MKLHLDGDIVVYRAGFAAEKMVYRISYFDEEYQEPVTVVTTSAKDRDAWLEQHPHIAATVEAEREAEPEANALYNAKSVIKTAFEQSGCDELQVYLSGSTNFRDEVATIKKYKGNRENTPKPTHAAAIKQFIDRHFDVIWSDNEEADDVIGYSHYAMWVEDPYSTVIGTLDKDLDMIPGLHFNFVKEEGYYVDPDMADRLFYEQLLKGDSTDNIPGLPGIGNKKAAALLKDVDDVVSMYQIARGLYRDAYEDGDAALLENARLLWIRRHEGELWLPPESGSTNETGESRTEPSPTSSSTQ